MRLHLILGVAGIVAALLIGVGATQYLFPPTKASQVTVAQNNLAIASRGEVASVKTPLRPVPDADGVDRADDQPLMATGLDLNGSPKRFSAKEILANLEVPGFWQAAAFDLTAKRRAVFSAVKNCRYWPIVLQKSKVADLRISRENTKRETTTDSYRRLRSLWNEREQGKAALFPGSDFWARRGSNEHGRTSSHPANDSFRRIHVHRFPVWSYGGATWGCWRILSAVV
jgi:hypothetical protein